MHLVNEKTFVLSVFYLYTNIRWQIKRGCVQGNEIRFEKGDDGERKAAVYKILTSTKTTSCSVGSDSANLVASKVT